MLHDHSTAPASSPPEPGATSPPPTTARRLRLYVNGTQVVAAGASGSILTSTAPLRIGGNAIWGECFTGLIDEVRIYNRALSAAEIQADMNTQRHPGHDAADGDGEERRPTAPRASTSGASVTATFSELMKAGTITTSSVPVEGRSEHRRPGERDVQRVDEHRRR